MEGNGIAKVKRMCLEKKREHRKTTLRSNTLTDKHLKIDSDDGKEEFTKS